MHLDFEVLHEDSAVALLRRELLQMGQQRLAFTLELKLKPGQKHGQNEPLVIVSIFTVLSKDRVEKVA